MKNITDDLMKTITEEEIDKRRNYVWLGKPQQVPKSVYKGMLKHLKYYEFESITELKENYGSFTQKIRLPFRTSVWVWGFLWKILFSQHKTNKHYLKLRKKYGKQRDRLLGEKYSFLDFLTMKVAKPNQIFLHDVALKNFHHQTNPLFSAYTFDIVDKNGDSILGVYQYEDFYNNIISQKESVMIEKKSTIEMAKNSAMGTKFALYGMVLDPSYTEIHKGIRTKNRGYRLKVTHIQDNGKKPKLELPFVGER